MASECLIFADRCRKRQLNNPTTPITDVAVALVPDVDASSSFSPSSATTDTNSNTNTNAKNTSLILTSAILGSLLLVVALLLFYVCMKRRQASRRRIGQLQDNSHLPPYMDEEKSEKYFKHHHPHHQIDTTSSASTLVSPPSNAHHRTRSAPIAFAFAKGGRRHSDTTNNATITSATIAATTTATFIGQGQGRIGRDPMMGQFQQISLVSEETEEDDVSLKRRSFSTSRDGGDSYGGYAGLGGSFGGGGHGSTRNRAKTVAVPIPVVSTLHRSVSLSNHGHAHEHSPGYYYDSRRAPHVDDEEPPHDPHDADALPTAAHLRFAEGESPFVSHYSSSMSTFPQHHNPFHHSRDQHNIPTTTTSNHSNRYSVGMGLHSHRGSISSAMEFDPSRFSTMSVMFDAKRLFTRSLVVPSPTATAGSRHPTGPPDSDDSDDESVSTSSSDGFNDLPPHQLSQHFESHNPYAVSTATTPGGNSSGNKQRGLNGEEDGENSGDEEEDVGIDEEEEVVRQLGVQHGYPVYGQTISPLSLDPVPLQTNSE
ncbi:hypothetical protein BGX33_003861 [Mortierella sp. NVP41]|nr:hypothetical protein BGX33_003861 [Mortierella sp. NVP41]